MSLGELLADDLIGWMERSPDGVPRRVLLWLDPERQFARLVEALRGDIESGVGLLLHCDPEVDGGQSRLKLTLLELEGKTEGRAVVYLPGFGRSDLEPRTDGSPPTLWAVYEYRFKGCIWGRGESWRPGEVPEPLSLLGWLRRHGLEVSDERTARKLAEGGSDSLLARYAVRMARRDPDGWPRPLRLSDVEDELGGDPRETLRRLLAAPHNEVRRWRDEGPTVLARLVSEYGFDLPLPLGEREHALWHVHGGEGSTQHSALSTQNPEPEALADALAVQLALAEAWDAFGQPADFPFLSRLPARTHHRRRMVDFLREDVLKHSELGPRFRARMARLEKSYDLSGWAAERQGRPRGLPLLARKRWKTFLQQLEAAAASGWKAARDLLASYSQTIAEGARALWDGHEGESQWGVLAKLEELCRLAAAATEEVVSMASPAALATTYRERWWRADWLHLEVRADCAATGGLEVVRRVADLAHFDYAARVNQRFAELVEAGGSWPPAGLAGADTLRDVLWRHGESRLAVILCDALRWDLGLKVLERLSGPDHSVEAVASVLPSETPFGMASLLPLGQERLAVDWSGGDLSVSNPSGSDLSTREARRAFLKATLVDRGGKAVVQFTEVESLLKGAPVPKSRVVVVFDNTLDEQGHKVPEQLPLLARQMAGNLARVVELLHDAGIDTVHLATDHGFLLLPPEEVAALGTPTVPVAQVLKREPRWAALKADAPTQEVIRLPSPFLRPPNVLGLARGVRTLVQPEPYLHGGLSLQECVIPHIVSRAMFRAAKLGLDLSVTAPNLTGGTVPVILRPVVPTEQQTFGGLQPLKLLLWVETSGEEGAEPRPATEKQPIELRPEVEELKPAVYLQEGLGLASGQKLLLRAVDAETGRDLGQVPLILVVDWD